MIARAGLACTVVALHALATLNADIWLACRHAEEAAGHTYMDRDSV